MSTGVAVQEAEEAQEVVEEAEEVVVVVAAAEEVVVALAPSHTCLRQPKEPCASCSSWLAPRQLAPTPTRRTIRPPTLTPRWRGRAI